jgi:Zn-finger nucleic acid-binding protein
VTIDDCPECAAVWLDAGELRSIRAEFPSDEARQQAADADFAELFDGPLAVERAKSEAELARARTFANAFRFLRPSWYVPGKQPWGAF